MSDVNSTADGFGAAASGEAGRAAQTGADMMGGAAQTGQRAFAAGQQAFKEGIDKAASSSNQAFKDAADRSLSALNELNAQGKRNLEAMIASVTAATRGAEQLGAQAVSYAKSSVETQVDAARQLSSARSMQEVVELQTSFARQAMEGYLAEMNRVSETVAAAVKEAMQPLNERAASMVEAVQAQR